MKVNVGQVYTTHKDHLYNYIFRLCSDHALAQDVVQQAFVKLLADPQLDEIENIKSYLFTIARNHLYDIWKKKTEVSTDDADILSAEPAGDNELSDDLNDEQIQQAVLICINRLSEKFRELMLLRYQEDLSIREIADITEFSESDIKVSLLRARKHFDQEMTQHMYLKIAASRQQCDDMDAMLSPYAGKEIPESDLTPFTAHISKCQLCAEDAEEQKQKRKLFALIPLVAAPLSLDTSFNDAVAQTTGTSGSATTAGKISLLKLAVGVGAVAIISGGLLLYSANNQPEYRNNTANSTPEHNTAPEKNNPTTAPTNNSTKGSVAINATLRLSNGGPAAVANWFIYRIDASHRDGQQHTAGHRGDQLNIKLDPGQYKIVARVGESEVSRFIEVKPNSDQTIELIAGAGTLSVSTPLPDSIKLYRSQLSFQVYKSHQDLQNHKLLLVKAFHKPTTRFTLPAGSYVIKAKYTGYGEIVATKNVNVSAGKTTELIIPLPIGIFKPVAILSGRDQPHTRNLTWKIISPRHTPYELIRNIKNNSEVPMAPGEYVFSTELGNIKQQSQAVIRHGQLTSHKVVLKGGTVNVTIWNDKAKQQRNLSKHLRTEIYPDNYRELKKKNQYIEKDAHIRNAIKNRYAILAEGKYTLVVKNTRDYKTLLIKDFDLRSGENKIIDLIIQGEGEKI